MYSFTFFHNMKHKKRRFNNLLLYEILFCFQLLDVYVKGGRENTGLDLIEWVKKCESLGAGEVLLTSMDADGTKAGYDIEMLNAVCKAVDIPVIASGGCGSIQDIIDVFEKTNVDAALVASLFHFNEATVEDVRNECKKHGINVRRTR